MATTLCTAIIGFFCLQSSIGDTMTIKHQDAGIFIADTIQTRDWTLAYGRSTEWASPVLDSTKLDKACTADGCKLYWRTCNDAAHPTMCSYALATDGGGSVSFTLTATTEAGLKLGKDQIAVELGGFPGATIPLSAFDREAAAAQPPVIPRTP